jgi:two-component system chemotaxis response regulator CheY
MSKILLIDDDERLRALIARGLRAGGHDLVEAGDGQRGVALARRSLPDLVITDISMPDQDGIQTIRELRELSLTLPIIVISGEQGVGAYRPLDDARLLGANVAMAKPFELAALLGEVQRLLRENAGGEGSPNSKK